MSRFHKVIWSEGMFLNPHHFQRFEQYLFNQQKIHLSVLNQYNWGLFSLEIDQNELANGSFSLLKCHGIMPDGSVIDISGTGKRPKSRPFKEKFSHSMDKCDVYLAIPIEQEKAPNCWINSPASSKEPADHQLRYCLEEVSLNDLNTGANEQKLDVAQLNFKILFSGDSLDNYTTIKIAELKPSATGGFSLQKEYVPPCLYINASPWIMQILQDLCSRLVGESANLAHLTHKVQTMPQLQAIEIRDFLKLMTINTFLPLIYHFYEQQKVHPELVYRFLVQLAGALSTFHPEIKPNTLALYQHNDLTKTFNDLFNIIKKLLTLTGGKNFEEIALQKIAGDKLLSGHINDDLLEKAQFFMVVIAEISSGQLQTTIPQVIKIASPSNIDHIIRQALPGVNLIFISRPPAGIPDSGGEFFQLDKVDVLWEDIRNEKQMVIFCPPQFRILNIKMYALKKQED